MKKLLINAALGVTLVALNVACEDFLNVQPKGETIPQTVDDYAYIMNFPDLMKGGENFPLYLTMMFICPTQQRMNLSQD